MEHDSYAMASLLRRLLRVIRVLDDIRSIKRALKLLGKLVRGLRGGSMRCQI